MAILCYHDATCRDAGSIIPTETERMAVLAAREAAVRWIQDAGARARDVILNEIGNILSEPEFYEFDSGYSYFAIALALPDEVQLVDDAFTWLTDMVEDDQIDQITVLSFQGAHFRPPDGDESAMNADECLEVFLDYIA